jgi:flavodoxin
MKRAVRYFSKSGDTEKAARAIADAVAVKAFIAKLDARSLWGFAL